MVNHDRQVAVTLPVAELIDADSSQLGEPSPVQPPGHSLEVVVNLIGHTTTRSGLAIRSELDANNYPTGQPVTAQQMESISLKRDKFHGDWNYSLAPK